MKTPKELDLLDPVFFRILGWIILFSISLCTFGFFVSVPIFNFAFLMIEARVRWQISLAATLIISFAIYYVFNFSLRVDLWPGMIPEIIPRFLGGGILPDI
jgi:hypothetical protein